MGSPVDSCNAALSHLGARAQVSSIDPPDGSVEAGYCARFYPIARRELIEAYAWPFAKTRVTLAEVANPSSIWTYAYAVPGDCIAPTRVLQLQYIDALLLSSVGGPLSDYQTAQVDQLFTERGSAQFEIENGVLLTNEPEAVLLYKRDVIDTSKFTPMFSSALGMLLAGYLAGPIIKGLDGAKVGMQWRQMAYDVAARAAAKAANGGNESSEFIPGQLAAR